MTETSVSSKTLAENFDDKRHALCSLCDGDVPIGGTFTAVCGRRAVRRHAGVPWPVPNACPECDRLDCPRCNR